MATMISAGCARKLLQTKYTMMTMMEPERPIDAASISHTWKAIVVAGVFFGGGELEAC